MLRVGAITNLCFKALAGDTAVLWTALFILKMCVNVIQNTKKIEIHVHHFHCGKLFQLFPFYAPSVGAYRFAHVRPSVHTLIRISCVRNPYIYKGILTKLSQMVHLNM